MQPGGTESQAMLEVPIAVVQESASAHAIRVVVMVLLDLGFCISLVLWTGLARSPGITALGFFLSHTVAGGLIISLSGGDPWLVFLCLLLIDWPTLVLWEWASAESSVLTRVFLYVLLGGAPYAVGGYLLGLAARAERRARKKRRWEARQAAASSKQAKPVQPGG